MRLLASSHWPPFRMCTLHASIVYESQLLRSENFDVQIGRFGPRAHSVSQDRDRKANGGPRRQHGPSSTRRQGEHAEHVRQTAARIDPSLGGGRGGRPVAVLPQESCFWRKRQRRREVAMATLQLKGRCGGARCRLGGCKGGGHHPGSIARNRLRNKPANSGHSPQRCCSGSRRTDQARHLRR